MSQLRQALPLLLAIGLAGCALGSGTKPSRPVSSPAADRAERPIYSLGDRWIRSDGIYELIRVESDRYVFSAGPGNEIHLAKDLVLLKTVFGGSVRFEVTPPPELTWPLEVGQRGSVLGTFKPPYGAPDSAQITWVVDAYEDIEVPASKFKAFRISFTARSLGLPSRGWQPGPTTSVYRFWYAPEVRQLVKSEGATRFEVIAVDPAETAPLKVDLREPKSDARFGGTAETAVMGNVTGGRGVGRVAISLNGEVVSREEAAARAKKAVVLNVPLRLREGKNVLLVTATDPAGVSTQEARTFFYDSPLRVTLPPAGQTVRVPREAIVLGAKIRRPRASRLGVFSVALNGAVVVALVTRDVEGESEITFEALMNSRTARTS